jgi:hypothetical protein
MPRKSPSLSFLVLLLGVLLLGAQLHFCMDMTGSPSDSHICPVCSVVGSAVAAQSPSIEIIQAANRLEVAPTIVTVFSAVPYAISPRAPPAL